MLKRYVVLLGAVLLATASLPQAVAADAETPQQIVQSIADQLGKAVDGHQAELRAHPDQAIQIIDRIILPHFDTDYAALLVLGRYARQATPDQRVEFTHAFYNALTHRYAEGLLAYTQGAVKVLPSSGPLDQDRTLVRTQVQLKNGKSISVDYAFRRTSSGQWKAYDVIIEGISYITNYRSQVAAQIQKEGIDGLIKELQTQGASAVGQMQPKGSGH
ncbi:MAG: MlaC/ttg2D family ABC transporter substrate-binding protein [Rhodanobacteraceae bacterium]